MENVKKINSNENVRTITANDFITARNLASLSLKARKLLYIAVSQCKMSDQAFYYYEISVKEFADLMDVSENHIYEEAYGICKELASSVLEIPNRNKKGWLMLTLFSKCKYEHNGIIHFKLNPDMTDLLLQLQGSFSKPLLRDFLKMRSTYSMAIWHLMQREMKSHKPGALNTIEFELSVKELREVTGNQNKNKSMSNFKERILDKALREIYDNCGVKITYDNIMDGRFVVGFHFYAISYYHVNSDDMPQNVKDKCELFHLKRESTKRKLSNEERDRYEFLENSVGQLEFRL